MALPDPAAERTPTPAELKKLQTAAGEMNWLATRTRADLAYYASVLASSSTRFADWSFQLWQKVLRYLVATARDGLKYPLGGSEADLVCWSGAGYGGEGTKAQPGVLISWGGAVTVWRSSRQHTSTLSTCEAEVSDAALAFQVLDGVDVPPLRVGHPPSSPHPPRRLQVCHQRHRKRRLLADPLLRSASGAARRRTPPEPRQAPLLPEKPSAE